MAAASAAAAAVAAAAAAALRARAARAHARGSIRLSGPGCALRGGVRIGRAIYIF
eukprot:SAG31_NODE_5527_length_2477_cov_1.710681_3_plen_55_part_00